MAKRATTEKRLYSVQEVCSLLDIGKTTFHKEVKEGRLLIVKIGRSTKITAECFEDYYNSLVEQSRLYRSKHPGRWSK